jgi:peptidoglycan/LPS O-acetylase OafA/YrhL
VTAAHRPSGQRLPNDASASGAGPVGAGRSPIGALRTVLSPPAPGSATGYFHAIDLLRGIAALSILFWHYVHFYMVGTVVRGYDPTRNPFYDQLWLLYDHGGNAVQLFWLISGFTFAVVYTQRQATTRTFVIHRFARLYPLQLVTLCVVAALQIASVRLLGHGWIYADNDLPHFVDQLLMTDGWGPTIRFSFNGPTWTVSVELLVYALFWVLLTRLFARGALFPLVIAVASLGLSRLGPFQHILQGGFFFFVGCALYPVFLACRGWRAAMALTVGLPLAAAAVVLERWHAVGAVSMLVLVSAVLGAAFVNVERLPAMARRVCRWVGDNTYGIYLWHVPVQITILTGASLLALPRTIFLSPAFLIGFVAVTVGLARTSFLLIERPSRSFLNARFSRPGPGAQADVAARRP